MKISRIELGQLDVPLKTPFRTALRTLEQLRDVVVILETDSGHRGYGSAASTAAVTGDTHGSVIDAIRTSIAPVILGEDICDINRVVELVQASMVTNFSAKAAIEIAVYDLFAQSFDSPLYKVLGGGNPHLSTDLTVSLGSIDTMVQDALDAVAQGFSALKIKVGTDPDLDIQRIRAIYAAVDNRALLRLDANQGWRPKQTVSVLRKLESDGIELDFIEQPVRGDDLDGMRYITERVSTPVMADESVFGPKQLFELIQSRAADFVNIKLMKTGGISNAIKMADIAAIYGVECMMGCMAETCISVSAAAHVAAAKANIITRIDLDAPALAAVDPLVGGVRFAGADIEISNAPGLGIENVIETSGLDFDNVAAL